MQDQQLLLDAVNTLIATTQPEYVADAISALAGMNMRYPVVFSGDLKVLNPILELRVHDIPTFERIQRLIDGKREDKGLPPIWPAPDREKFNKVAYQRKLMATRRRLARSALEIENAQRPERDRLIGSARLDFENRVLSEWGAALDKKLDQLRLEVGGSLSRDQATAVRNEHWEAVERELDERFERLRQEQLKPAHMRRKV